MKMSGSDLYEKAIKYSIKHFNGLQIVIFYLRIEKNLTLKQIAKKLCITHQAISYRLKEIYKKIEKLKNENIS